MQIFREPCYYAEAVYLLYNFVNDISYEGEFRKVVRSFGYYSLNDDKAMLSQKIQELARIAKVVTEDINPNGERLQYFFKKLPGTNSNNSCCLAQVMLLAIPINCNDVDDFRVKLVNEYKLMTETGIKINSLGPLGLNISPKDADEKSESLAAQLEHLSCSVEARWMILRAMTEFDEHTTELTELLRNVAVRLRNEMGTLVAMNQSAIDNWERYFSEYTIDNFQMKMFGSPRLLPKTVRTHDIWLSLWYFNFWGTWSEWMEKDGCLVRTIYIGMIISFDFAVSQKKRPDVDTLCDMLKVLSGKDKLETLKRCANQAVSASNLVSAMSLNPGTVSRNIYGLCHHGFLSAKECNNRICYSACTDKLQQLFSWIIEYINDLPSN